MFNGIIYFTGKIFKIRSRSNGLDLFIKSKINFKKNDIGSSVSCDGVCLTLVSYSNLISRYYISNETIKRSKFKNIDLNNKINLELPLKYGKRISGHLIQGHVDTVGKILSIKKQKSWIIDISVKNFFLKNIIYKASIAINGVSLTVSKIKLKSFEICIIPHTLKLTNLVNLKNKDLVNIEIDIMSKYIKNFLNEKK